MGKAYKIVITGSFNAGKSEFIRMASDIPVVSTDRKVTDGMAEVKDTTTVAMDYGQVTVAGRLFHLYGTPGQDRFDFMWDILAREMDGLVILVDGTDAGSISVARRLLRHFRRRNAVPVLVAVTKQDNAGAMTLEDVAGKLRIEPANLVISCDTRQKASTHEVLQYLSTLFN